MTFLGETQLATRKAWALLVVGIVLAMAAAVFLFMAKNTPWHTDSKAYFEGVAASYSSAGAFYQNLHRYETSKWVYADIGYACSAWAVAMLVLTALVNECGWRVVIRTNNNPKVLVSLTLLSCALMLAGLWGNGLQLLGRGEVYDGSTGPINAGMAAATVAMLVGTLVFMSANLAPLIWKPTSGGSLVPITPAGRSVVVSLLYAPFCALPLFLMIASFAGPGGWGMSTGAVIAIWLILNARALIVSHRPARLCAS